MKISGRGVDGFLRDVGTGIAAVLLYGPDRGLVRERADRLVTTIAGNALDPFAVSEISIQQLRERPSLIVDETAAMTFNRSRRVVRLRDAGDGQSRAVDGFLQAAAGGLLVVEADELGPRSSLRQLFEAADNAAAVPCYREEGDELAHFIAEELRRANLALSDDAREHLVATLGGDRGVTRRELEKLMAYMGGPGRGATVQLADVMACTGDSAPQSIDELVLAVADGDMAAVDRLTGRVLDDGAAPVAILRAASRHFLRLHVVASAGGDRERVMRGFRPPVFFKSVPRFHAQARRWPPARLHQAIDRLLRAEIDCKRTGTPAGAMCRQVLMEIAARVPR